MTSYYTFTSCIGLVFRAAIQLYLFLFLVPVPAGTLLGGPLGDRIDESK
jgi:hypothetical protein